MKSAATLLFSLLMNLCFGNMASPIINGTRAALPFINQWVDITSERIQVKLSSDFKTAHYTIDYYINAQRNGKQVPLLFYAMDYKGDFKVQLDSADVKLLRLPKDTDNWAGNNFPGFEIPYVGANNMVSLKWDDDDGYKSFFPVNDMKYFEVALSKGAHHVHVEYDAKPEINRKEWVKNYNFSYSLSPAKYWRSFGKLQVTVDATALAHSITTSFNKPVSGRLDSVATWQFDSLPAEAFSIYYTPRISELPQALIEVSPLWLTVMVGVLLAILHYLGLRYLYRQNSKGLYWSTLIGGGLILPFITLLAFLFWYEVIDGLIGEEAGRYHGYMFLAAFFLYPVLMAPYMLVLIAIDRVRKRMAK